MFRRIALPLCFCLAACSTLTKNDVVKPAATKNEVTIDFNDAVITGKPISTWTEHGVNFALAWDPTYAKAPAQITFFPHIQTDRKGILSAMAEEAIPVRATFPVPVSSVTLVLWGPTDGGAVVEAYDKAGNVLDHVTRPVVPGRLAPGGPVPSFELTVKGTAIASVAFGCARDRDYLVADELRYTPAIMPAPGAPAPANPPPTAPSGTATAVPAAK